MARLKVWRTAAGGGNSTPDRETGAREGTDCEGPWGLHFISELQSLGPRANRAMTASVDAGENGAAAELVGKGEGLAGRGEGGGTSGFVTFEKMQVQCSVPKNEAVFSVSSSRLLVPDVIFRVWADAQRHVSVEGQAIRRAMGLVRLCDFHLKGVAHGTTGIPHCTAAPTLFFPTLILNPQSPSMRFTAPAAVGHGPAEKSKLVVGAWRCLHMPARQGA